LAASTSRAVALNSAVPVTLCDVGRITPNRSASSPEAGAAAVAKMSRVDPPLTVRRSRMNP
jgi:hypothetical protein